MNHTKTDETPYPKATVVVTVHNREQYIGQCLDSIIAQTLRDIEIICVDDASTDRSYEILQRYAAHDNRIRLHRFEENGGVQRSRNHALNAARGEFIFFVDDDDWLGTDCVELCIQRFTEDETIDCVVLSEIRQAPDGRQYEPSGQQKIGKITGEEAFLLSLPWRISGNFCVRTEFQKQHPYDNSCRYFGDENTGRMTLLSSKYVVQAEGTYYYRMTEDSVCHSKSIGHYSRLQAQRVLADTLRTMRGQQHLRKAYETFCWENIIHAYMRYYKERGEMSAAMRHEVLALIKQAWKQADSALASPSITRKFGYIPFRSSWRMFRIQEETYFFLRTILGRI